MKILEKEIQLRDETRVAEQARPALSIEEYWDETAPLANDQIDLVDRVRKVVEDILDLPRGESQFHREVALLEKVDEVMLEAVGLLQRPETGPPTIAAETEAIELLLQARRINPEGGGGGGSSPGGGGGGTTQQSALALLGTGGAQAQSQPRSVEQGTGKSGRQLPEEFRRGLDAYFNALEQSSER